MQSHAVAKDDRVLYYDLADAEKLTPTSSMVYSQWKMDPNNEFLVSGYIRTEYDINPLGQDITNIIICFYEKKFTKREINSKIRYKLQDIERAQKLKQYQKEQKVEKTKTCLTILFTIVIVPIIAIIFIAIVLGADIAALTINSKNNCNLATQSTGMIDLDGYEFLLIGSIVHLIAIVVPLCIVWVSLAYVEFAWHILYWGSDYSYVYVMWGCILCVDIFIFSWSIVGFVLHANMDTTTPTNKQCAGVTLLWCIFKLIEILIHPCVLWFYFCLADRHDHYGYMI
eukprot:167226_1